MTNTNEKTGVRFGYISSNKLDSEVVQALVYDYGTDYSYEEYVKENPNEEDYEDYENDEPSIEGLMDGVSYGTSWLGGALNFFIFESPVIVKRALCSPCVPNAGDLGNPGDFECYGVPEDWRYEK